MPKLNGVAIGMVGFIGKHHWQAARTLLGPRFEVDYCVPGPANEFKKNRPIAEALGFETECIFPDIATMLSEVGDKVDAGFVATPNNVHGANCVELAEAGKHVVVDKPLSTSAAEADIIVEAIEKAGVKSLVTATYCGFAPILEARERILKGGVNETVRGGRFLYDQVWLRQLLSQMTSATGLDQAKWRKDVAQSGPAGAIGDLSHLIFQVYFITGLRVIKVWADRRWVVEGYSAKRTEDQTVGRLLLENGAEITLEATQWVGGHTNDNNWELWLADGRAFGWSMTSPELLWEAPGGSTRTYYNLDSFTTGIIGATKSMPAGHGDEGWTKADARLIYSLAWDVLGEVPEGGEIFHPDVMVGRNVNAVLDAMVASANGDTPRQWVDVDWR